MDLVRCEIDSETPERYKEWFNMYPNDYFYCLQDKEMFMKGIKDLRYQQKDNSFIIFEWEKCHDQIRKKAPKDP